MIAGVGTDIIEIDRIARSMKKERFLLDYFGEKEAFAKSIGTGVRGFLLREVQVLRGPLGEVFLQLDGKAAKQAAERGMTCFHVSVSHCKEYAVATVIAEQ